VPARTIVGDDRDIAIQCATFDLPADVPCSDLYREAASMTDQTKSPAKRTGPQILSSLLFIAAIGFAAAAVYIWYMDDSDSTDEPPVPTAEAGMYQLVNVLTELKNADLDADYGRSPATAKSNQIDPPGQNLKVGDANVFIFIFPGADPEAAAAAREQAFGAIDPATMTLTTPSGSDVSNGQPLTVYQGANIIAVVVGGDSALQAEIQAVIEGLD
jgi:hypothetical protein